MIFVIEVDGGTINILDAAGNVINPAKEDGNLADLKTILTAIRDTAGVKKITDALPAGDNNIGNVDAIQSGTWTVQQGTPPWSVEGAEASGSPPTKKPVLAAGQDGTNLRTLKTNTAGRIEEVLFDSDGHAVGVVLDGALYRFQVDGKVAKGASDLVHLDAIDTATGKGRLKATLYSPEGEAIAFGSVPPSAASIKNDFTKNGTDESLLVNGSSTPVIFSYPADGTKDISLQEIKFVMASNSITFGSSYFGSVAGPLANGLLVQVTAGGDTGTIYNLKQNESFVNFASPGGFNWVVSSKDMMSATYLIGGALKLKAGTADAVKVTVRDNLTTAAVYFKCFVKANLLA